MAQLKDLIVNGCAKVLGKIYATEFVGQLTGVADKAIRDGSGNVIDMTYATRTEVAPVNNLLATTAGKPLDAVQGKTLSDKIVQLSSEKTINIDTKPIVIGFHGGQTINAKSSYTVTSGSTQYLTEKYFLSLFGLSIGSTVEYKISVLLMNEYGNAVLPPEFGGKFWSPSVDVSALRLVNISKNTDGNPIFTFINQSTSNITIPSYNGTHQLLLILYLPQKYFYS